MAELILLFCGTYILSRGLYLLSDIIFNYNLYKRGYEFNENFELDQIEETEYEGVDKIPFLVEKYIDFLPITNLLNAIYTFAEDRINTDLMIETAKFMGIIQKKPEIKIEEIIEKVSKENEELIKEVKIIAYLSAKEVVQTNAIIKNNKDETGAIILDKFGEIVDATGFFNGLSPRELRDYLICLVNSSQNKKIKYSKVIEYFNEFHLDEYKNMYIFNFTDFNNNKYKLVFDKENNIKNHSKNFDKYQEVSKNEIILKAQEEIEKNLSVKNDLTLKRINNNK